MKPLPDETTKLLALLKDLTKLAKQGKVLGWELEMKQGFITRPHMAFVENIPTNEANITLKARITKAVTP